MASRVNVERLFTLPYFQETFDQMIRPMADVSAQVLCAEEDHIDPKILSNVVLDVHKYVYQGVMQIVMNLYTEVLSDEDVEFLYSVYQNPTMLKLKSGLQTLMPMMVAWYEENKEAIRHSVEIALRKAV
jgi:hypothetical protein